MREIEIFETWPSVLQKPQVFRSGSATLENEDFYLTSILFFFLGQFPQTAVNKGKRLHFSFCNLEETYVSKDSENEHI